MPRIRCQKRAWVPNLRSLLELGSVCGRSDSARRSKALAQHFVDILGGSILPPISVGKWIPKAKLGPTANFFRPLGMPSTFERLLDCAIAAQCVKHIASSLHPAQTVLNEFREPQNAVLELQAALDSHKVFRTVNTLPGSPTMISE